MKSCKIHFLTALAGDCFVLEFISRECIIVDCGYKSTYENELKPLLIELKNKGCKVTLLLITHTDKDHIEGAIEFIRDNGNSTSPNIIQVDSIWYNGIINTLSFNPEIEKRNHDSSSIQQKNTNHLLAVLLSQLPDRSGDISANNCLSFEEICFRNGYSINSCFHDRIVRRTYTTYSEKLNSAIKIGECMITVLSPSLDEIKKLSNALHYDMLKQLGKDYAISNDSKFVKLCELFLELKTDKANCQENISSNSALIENWIGTSKLSEMNAVNKASIVIEIQFGELKMLFTGDSESELWYELLDKEYDVIKISHHGTTKPNMKMLESTHTIIALISTNGSSNNQHPEKETLARIIKAGYKNIYFNYDHPFKSILIDNQVDYGYSVFFKQESIEL